MTDRYSSLTVVLEKDIREDDAEALLAAIGMMRGVLLVRGNVNGVPELIAQARAFSDMRDRILNALRDAKP